MSHTDELARLAELHRNGDLTDEEFAAAKKGLLGTTISGSPPEKVKSASTVAQFTAAEEKLPESKSLDLVNGESKNGSRSPSIKRWTLVVAGLILVSSIALLGRHNSSNSSKIQLLDSVSKAPTASPSESILGSYYQIISENETAIDTLDKGDVGVELSRKLSNDEITIIAKQIRQDKSRYKSLHITFWLKGVSKNALPYATAIFEPDLKVERLGSTDEEQQQAALVAKQKIDGKVIGRWHGNEYTPWTYLFYEKNGKTYQREIFEPGITDSGSSAPSSNDDGELTKRKVHGSTRFYEKGGHPDEYDIINKDGNLEFYDEEGYITTSMKIQ